MDTIVDGDRWHRQALAESSLSINNRQQHQARQLVQKFVHSNVDRHTKDQVQTFLLQRHDDDDNDNVNDDNCVHGEPEMPTSLNRCLDLLQQERYRVLQLEWEAAESNVHQHRHERRRISLLERLNEERLLRIQQLELRAKAYVYQEAMEQWKHKYTHSKEQHLKALKMWNDKYNALKERYYRAEAHFRTQLQQQQGQGHNSKATANHHHHHDVILKEEAGANENHNVASTKQHQPLQQERHVDIVSVTVVTATHHDQEAVAAQEARETTALIDGMSREENATHTMSMSRQKPTTASDLAADPISSLPPTAQLVAAATAALTATQTAVNAHTHFNQKRLLALASLDPPTSTTSRSSKRSLQEEVQDRNNEHHSYSSSVYAALADVESPVSNTNASNYKRFRPSLHGIQEPLEVCSPIAKDLASPAGANEAFHMAMADNNNSDDEDTAGSLNWSLSSSSLETSFKKAHSHSQSMSITGTDASNDNGRGRCTATTITEGNTEPEPNAKASPSPLKCRRETQASERIRISVTRPPTGTSAKAAAAVEATQQPPILDDLIPEESFEEERLDLPRYDFGISKSNKSKSSSSTCTSTHHGWRTHRAKALLKELAKVLVTGSGPKKVTSPRSSSPRQQQNQKQARLLDELAPLLAGTDNTSTSNTSSDLRDGNHTPDRSTAISVGVGVGNNIISIENHEDFEYILGELVPKSNSPAKKTNTEDVDPPFSDDGTVVPEKLLVLVSGEQLTTQSLIIAEAMEPASCEIPSDGNILVIADPLSNGTKEDVSSNAMCTGMGMDTDPDDSAPMLDTVNATSQSSDGQVGFADGMDDGHDRSSSIHPHPQPIPVGPCATTTLLLPKEDALIVAAGILPLHDEDTSSAPLALDVKDDMDTSTVSIGRILPPGEPDNALDADVAVVVATMPQVHIDNAAEREHAHETENGTEEGGTGEAHNSFNCNGNAESALVAPTSTGAANTNCMSMLEAADVCAPLALAFSASSSSPLEQADNDWITTSSRRSNRRSMKQKRRKSVSIAKLQGFKNVLLEDGIGIHIRSDHDQHTLERSTVDAIQELKEAEDAHVSETQMQEEERATGTSTVEDSTEPVGDDHTHDTSSILYDDVALACNGSATSADKASSSQEEDKEEVIVDNVNTKGDTNTMDDLCPPLMGPSMDSQEYEEVDASIHKDEDTVTSTMGDIDPCPSMESRQEADEVSDAPGVDINTSIQEQGSTMIDEIDIGAPMDSREDGSVTSTVMYDTIDDPFPCPLIHSQDGDEDVEEVASEETETGADASIQEHDSMDELCRRAADFQEIDQGSDNEHENAHDNDNARESSSGPSPEFPRMDGHEHDASEVRDSLDSKPDAIAIAAPRDSLSMSDDSALSQLSHSHFNDESTLGGGEIRGSSGSGGGINEDYMMVNGSLTKIKPSRRTTTSASTFTPSVNTRSLRSSRSRSPFLNLRGDGSTGVSIGTRISDTDTHTGSTFRSLLLSSSSIGKRKRGNSNSKSSSVVRFSSDTNTKQHDSHSQRHSTSTTGSTGTNFGACLDEEGDPVVRLVENQQSRSSSSVCSQAQIDIDLDDEAAADQPADESVEKGKHIDMDTSLLESDASATRREASASTALGCSNTGDDNARASEAEANDISAYSMTTAFSTGTLKLDATSFDYKASQESNDCDGNMSHLSAASESRLEQEDVNINHPSETSSMDMETSCLSLSSGQVKHSTGQDNSTGMDNVVADHHTIVGDCENPDDSNDASVHINSSSYSTSSSSRSMILMSASASLDQQDTTGYSMTSASATNSFQIENNKSTLTTNSNTGNDLGRSKRTAGNNYSMTSASSSSGCLSNNNNSSELHSSQSQTQFEEHDEPPGSPVLSRSTMEQEVAEALLDTTGTTPHDVDVDFDLKRRIERELTKRSRSSTRTTGSRTDALPSKSLEFEADTSQHQLDTSGLSVDRSGYSISSVWSSKQHHHKDNANMHTSPTPLANLQSSVNKSKSTDGDNDNGLMNRSHLSSGVPGHGETEEDEEDDIHNTDIGVDVDTSMQSEASTSECSQATLRRSKRRRGIGITAVPFVAPMLKKSKSKSVTKMKPTSRRRN
jgi:hypothetical protein